MLRLDFGSDSALKVACTTAEVAGMVGVSERQIRYWTNQALVRPSIRRGHGRGCVHLFSFDDLLQVRAIVELRSCGCSLQKLRRAIELLRRIMQDPDPLRYAVLAYDEGRLLAFYNTQQGRRACVDALNAGGQQVLEIVLETLKEDTLRLLAKGV